MNAWWWVLIGLAAWFAIALVVVGLWLSPVLRRSSHERDTLESQAREALDSQVRAALDAPTRETPARHQDSARNGPRVA